MDFFEILKQIMLPNKDNGRHFTDTQRLEKINALLWPTRYKRVNTDGLFVLFSVKPMEEICSPILISSHVDCVMDRFFTEEYDEATMIGAYDNGITNAAVLSLMLDGRLNDDVIVAFTGDEESDSAGAAQLCDYLSKNGIRPLATVVLDVTGTGWGEADFTVENNFWSDALGRSIVGAVSCLDTPWKFVPSDPEDLPDYIPTPSVVHMEAWADESWEYDERDLECFSLCLPVKGEMHGNAGVLARKSSCLTYIRALHTIVDHVSQQKASLLG